MISSMLVTESLSGDAAKINKAGSLRMQAIRISRTQLFNYQSSNQKEELAKERKTFDNNLNHLLNGGLLSSENDIDIETQYQQIIMLWNELKIDSGNNYQNKKVQDIIAEFDAFVSTLDKLVTLLQLNSEKKLRVLRLIQGISLLAVLIISIFILVKLNKSLIVPLKQLVNVANETGKGNFDLQAQYYEDNELGVLANAINQMSSELKATYHDFEQRVEQKTLQLTQSNQSLEMLFHAAKQLTSYDSKYNSATENQYIDSSVINELEQVLGFGKINIQLTKHQRNHLLIDIVPSFDSLDNICFNHLKFPLEKQTLIFGYLIWQFPKNTKVSLWQQQILQAMAGIISTAIELDQKRNSENRLLIMEERAVIARELHDSLAQSLSYLKVQMSLLTRKTQKKVPYEQLNETIDDIKQGLNSAYIQLRELLTTFRLKLDDPSLESSLQGTIAEYKEKCQHSIKLEYLLPDNFLNANQEIHLLQIIREALSNIHRHAKATQAGVKISHQQNNINVEIWDNGQGLPKEFSQQGHFGLGIMEERAKSLNSLIEVTNILPHGTQIALNFTK